MDQSNNHTRIILKFAFIITAFITVLALVCSNTPAATAQAGSAVVRTDPATLEVGQGQVEALNIVIDNAQAVYGIDLSAKFDPSVFEIVDADPTKDGVQMVPGDFIKPDFLVRNTADNQKGTLQYVITQVNPTPPANGSGVVLTIWVRGKVLGKRTPFTISSIQIADRKGTTLSVRAQNGTISVVSPKPPTPTATSMATPTVAATQTPQSVASVVETPEQTSPSTRPAASNTSTLVDLLLILVALGGCLGGVAIIVIAGIFVVRRPQRGPINRK